jgi:hypothetical protein
MINAKEELLETLQENRISYKIRENHRICTIILVPEKE